MDNDTTFKIRKRQSQSIFIRNQVYLTLNLSNSPVDLLSCVIGAAFDVICAELVDTSCGCCD